MAQVTIAREIQPRPPVMFSVHVGIVLRIRKEPPMPARKPPIMT